MSWQTVQIQAAASFLRERIAAGDSSVRTKAIYEGLLDVMDPARRATRGQREDAATVRSAAAAAVKADDDRRIADRRRERERRTMNSGSPTGVERRRGLDRRLAARDRRNRP
jgi:hypothetical protein